MSTLLEVVHGLIPAAVAVGRQSPCAKSKRGVVVFHPVHDNRLRILGTRVVGRGRNAQPPPRACTGSAACREACAMTCVHAELAAILDAGKAECAGAHMLHVKVVDGQAVPSGGPSCWQCSRHILHAGVGTMWLLHDGGLRGYSAEEFDRLTREACDIVIA